VGSKKRRGEEERRRRGEEERRRRGGDWELGTGNWGLGTGISLEMVLRM
jgi:hypothetical protein